MLIIISSYKISKIYSSLYYNYLLNYPYKLPPVI